MMKSRTRAKRGYADKDFSKTAALKRLHDTIDNKGPGSFTAAMKSNLARHREKRLKLKNGVLDIPEEIPPPVVIPQTPSEPVEKLKIVRVKHVFDPFAQQQDELASEKFAESKKRISEHSKVEITEKPATGVKGLHGMFQTKDSSRSRGAASQTQSSHRRFITKRHTLYHLSNHNTRRLS